MDRISAEARPNAGTTVNLIVAVGPIATASVPREAAQIPSFKTTAKTSSAKT